MSMRPLTISLLTVPTDAARAFIEAKDFEPDANLSPIDKPPKAVLELKGDSLRERRLADWKFAQGIKIEQSKLVKKQQAFDTAGRRWYTCRVVAVAIKPFDGEPLSMSGDKEKPILKKLFELLTDKYPSYSLLAKGGKDHVLPLLIGRAMALDLGLPPQLRSNYSFSDIHEIWGRSSQSTQRGDLESYAFGIGLKMDAPKESAQYLHDQHQLGSETALQQMQVQCAQETQIIDALVKRYLKPFPTAREIQLAEDSGDLQVPF